MIDNPVKETSRILLRSNQQENGKELVLVVGYTSAGKFGYFITYENLLTNEREFIDTVKFKVKSNEESYAEILLDFRDLVVSNK